jgi:DNA-binding HxlR family transcriptional regulator
VLTPADDDFLACWYDARALTAANWTPSILMALLDGPLHYREIKSIVTSFRVSDRRTLRPRTFHESSLSRTLSRMTNDGLLDRRECSGAFPPSVTYSLTPAARAIVDAVVPMAAWAQRNQAIIRGARSTVEPSSINRADDERRREDEAS